ncbi:hypothetical protein [Stakelama pacifica]|uniref:Uncharacterized protein n=1 Tax=Stakelama pacifica TaxID=517720 RepID=A0A4V3BUB6_9SPHN|nr:hypothetical protein [Stakelama pacifica]MAW99646.1 hypothetical protein [Sphingomonas sp.]TDN86648.1 hypothetical protein EV664_101222 [Stakelama pacifica]GGO90269.1 hypothetical protein GCM10011329_02180 [Stakelama pacifica]
MTDQSDVARARTSREIAKAQMLGTYDALRMRVKPANLAGDAACGAKRMAVNKPAKAGLILGGIAVLLFARPAYAAMRRCRSKRVATAAATKR